MLTLTDQASTAVKNIVAQSPSAPVGGLRINSKDGDASELAVAIVPVPEESDIVVTNDGAQVFLEEIAAQALENKILDAKVSEEGSVSFAITTAP